MPVVYSHSRLSCFENCPKQFHFRYVLKIPAESESIEAFLGKQVHAVLERLQGFVDRGMVPSLERVLYRFRAMWAETFDPERVRVVRDDVDARHYVEAGERCLTNHYRAHYPFDADETLGLEKPVGFTLCDERGWRVRGIVDRLVRARDGAIEIHDYKTGRRLPNQKQLDADRQLALYQLAVAGEYGADQPVRLVWHYLLHGKTRTSERTPEQLEELRQRTLRLVERIEDTEQFPARTSPLCGWCEYRALCPAVGGREPVAVGGREPVAVGGREPVAARAVVRTAGRARSARGPAPAPSPAPGQLSLL